MSTRPLRTKTRERRSTAAPRYDGLLSSVTVLLEQARRTSAHAVNAILTGTYWEVGRRIVKHEQAGQRKAGYGESLLTRLSEDLTERFGRGFRKSNLFQMRAFYLAHENIFQTLSGISPGTATQSVLQTPSALSGASHVRTDQGARTLSELARAFPLPWSHYVRLLAVRNADARSFYEAEALRGGWSVRQLDRQIATQFFERTALSKNKAAMLRKAEKPRTGEVATPEEEIKDPYVLEFLGLRDEYSESDLESALIGHLERFLLELGGEFAFIGRQRRLRVGNEWYRIDLLFFHRKLRCLVVIDLKVGKFNHADAGQMHLYLNYAREHWQNEGENPPVGIILCAQKDSTVARYALEGLSSKILAAEYKLALPGEKQLVEELRRTQQALLRRQ